jgi:hypothetical protein
MFSLLHCNSAVKRVLLCLPQSGQVLDALIVSVLHSNLPNSVPSRVLVRCSPSINSNSSGTTECSKFISPAHMIALRSSVSNQTPPSYMKRQMVSHLAKIVEAVVHMRLWREGLSLTYSSSSVIHETLHYSELHSNKILSLPADNYRNCCARPTRQCGRWNMDVEYTSEPYTFRYL